MDHDILIYSIMFLFFCLATCIEYLRQINQKEKAAKLRVKRLNDFVEEQRKRKTKEREATIDYLTRFRLEYDPDTHMYVKVEKLRPDEVEHVRSNK